MKIRFSYRKIDKNEKKQLKELVARGEESLEPLLSNYDPEAVVLDGAIEKHAKRQLYRARLKLHLPHKTLAAVEESDSAASCLNGVFAELRRQLERYKHLSRNDHLWKRPRRRAQLRSLLKESTTTDEQEMRRSFMNLVRPHLEELYHFIRRELAYHQALEDLSPADAGPDEILDSTLVRAYERFPQRPEHLELLPWLTSLALEVIGEEMEAHRVRERRVATEEREPETPMDVTDGIDTEIYEFYQPDEVIRLEDVIPNPESPIPEEAEALLERNLLVQEVLALLPRRWRQALVLVDVHEMQETEVAGILGCSQDELAEMRRCAERFMREWLAQRLGPDEIEDTTTEELLGSPLREPLPDELEAEILEKFMPMEAE